MAKKVSVEQEMELVKFVKQKLDNCNLSDYKMQAFLNLAYYVGKQWVTLDKNTQQLIEPEKEPWEVRLVANRVNPIVRTELAKITKNKPISEVVPASNDETDIQAARTAEKICLWLEHELKLANADRDICLDGLIISMGFMKPFWNPNKGEELQDLEGKPFKTGDVDKDVVSFFDMKFDMSASRWEDVRWACQEKARNVDEIFETYNVKVEPEKDLVSTNTYDSKLRSLNTTWGTGSYKRLENCAMVREYWERPSAKYPKGRRITTASDKALYYSEDIGFGEEDTTERELPFFPYVHIKVPGRVPGMSVVEQLIPVQREYNKSRSQIIQHKNLMCNPKWLVEANSLVDDITDEPGQTIEYKPGHQPPVMTQPTSIGSDVYRNIEQCIEEFFFISGQQEVSHGSAPAGVKSGVAIKFLQEQDDTKLGPSIQNFIDFKNAYMSYFLKMIRYKTPIERVINIVGNDGKIEAVTFKGSDVTSTTVRVQEGSMFQTSKSAKQQYVFDLIQSGVLNPQTDRQIILKMLELGLTDSLYDDTAIDSNKAQSENELWKKGDTSPIVRDFFNHNIHILEHNKFRKSDDFEQLPPEIQNAIAEHIMQHENFLMPQQPNMPMMGSGRTPVSELIQHLSPQEQEAIVKDPTILDEYHGKGGMTNG